jgi:purine-binding chemotaxis protein CheW
MRNVIVFATEHGRFAVELRWVREVITMGYVTPVPGAPAPIAGAVNIRGSITPVIDVGALGTAPAVGPHDRGSHGSVRERHGDGAVLIDVEDAAVALRIIKVDEVATVGDGGSLPSDTCGGAATQAIVDSRGQPVPLIDPPTVIALTLAAASALAADPLSGLGSATSTRGGKGARVSDTADTLEATPPVRPGQGGRVP